MVGGRNGDITLHLTSVEVRGGEGEEGRGGRVISQDVQKMNLKNNSQQYKVLILLCCKTVMNKTFMFNIKLFTEIVNQISFQ